MHRNDKLRLLQRATPVILPWAEAEGIELRRVEYMVPFGAADVSLGVWFFFPCRHSVAASDRSGATRRLADRFLEVLQQQSCPLSLIKHVSFRFLPDA